VDISYIATPYPNHLDTDDICSEFSLNPLLSNSEQQSLELHSTFSLLGHSSLSLSMISRPSMAYRVLLVVSASLPNWVLGLPPQNGFHTFSVSISRLLIQLYKS
jgi:hypothetical protein